MARLFAVWMVCNSNFGEWSLFSRFMWPTNRSTLRKQASNYILSVVSIVVRHFFQLHQVCNTLVAASWPLDGPMVAKGLDAWRWSRTAGPLRWKVAGVGLLGFTMVDLTDILTPLLQICIGIPGYHLKDRYFLRWRFEKVQSKEICFSLVGTVPNCWKDRKERSGQFPDFFWTHSGQPLPHWIRLASCKLPFLT